MTAWQRFTKRSFDVVVAGFALAVCWPILVVAIWLARYSTGLSGLFRQERVGLHGRLFTTLKIRSMRPVEGVLTTVTSDRDPRITRIGRLLRKTKIDELPQLINVLRGEMSLVGPRPDVAAQVALTPPSERELLLSMRPGVTGPASVKYREEERLLAACDDPEWVNNHVIWPDKVRVNLEYLESWSLWSDIVWLIRTVLPGGGVAELPTEAAKSTRRAA